MAKKVYRDGNYVITEDGSEILYFPAASSVFEKSAGNLTIQNTLKDESKGIAEDDAGLYVNELAVAYTAATLEAFYLANTANFNTASGGSDALLTHELYLTDAQILAPLVDAILIPVPSAGKYFTDVTINMELTASATPYDASVTHFVIHSPNGISPSFPIKQILESSFNNFYSKSIEPYVDQTPQLITADSGLYLSNLGNLPTIGRGDLRFKTTYRLKTLTV